MFNLYSVFIDNMDIYIDKLAVIVFLLQTVPLIEGQPYYYYDQNEADSGYYRDADNAHLPLHTMGIPHTKDNSMRALVDIITPKQTSRTSPTATTRKNSEDLYMEYYDLSPDRPGLVNGTKSQSYYDWNDYYDDYYGEDYNYNEGPVTNHPLAREETANDTITNSTTQRHNASDSTSSLDNHFEVSTAKARGWNTTDSTHYESNITQTTSKTYRSRPTTDNRLEELRIKSVFSTSTTTQPPPHSIDPLYLDYGETGLCDLDTQTGCDVIHFERCDLQTRRCRCLNGYVRNSEERGQCQAASFYHGHVTIKIGTLDRRNYEQKMSLLRLDLLQTVRQLFRDRSGVKLLDVSINSLETRDGELTISFDLSMAKDSLLSTDNIGNLWKEIVLLSSSGDLQPFVSINITANAQEKGFNLFSPLVEINQCARQGYHHCSQMAHCLYQSPKVTCRCQPGFEDAAADLHRLPGEVCIEKCTCKNGGLCLDVDETKGTKQCSCLPWYLGTECEIDGKELLVICLCCLGLLILITASLCCGCLARAKHKEKVAKARMFHFSPEPNIIKLPRVWMDTPSYHDDLSPQNVRRMSMASAADVNEYFGGFILEDLSGSTIQRHADALNSYYQTTANLCGVPSSSQQSLFRY